MSSKKIKYHLILLAVNDHVTPKELIKLGYSMNTAYLYTRRAKQIIEDYYTDRKRLKDLRAKV